MVRNGSFLLSEGDARRAIRGAEALMKRSPEGRVSPTSSWRYLQKLYESFSYGGVFVLNK